MLVSVHSLVVNTLGWQVEGCWFVSQKLSFVRRCIGGKNSQIKPAEQPALQLHLLFAHCSRRCDWLSAKKCFPMFLSVLLFLM